MSNYFRRISRSTVAVVFLGSILFCGTGNSNARKNPADTDVKSSSVFMQRDFDEFGRPVFLGKLDDENKPDSGEYYIVFFDESNRFISSVKILSGDKIPIKSTSLGFSWTKRGFQTGLRTADRMRPGSIQNPAEILIYTAVVLTVPVITTGAGLVSDLFVNAVRLPGYLSNKVQQIFTDNKDQLVEKTVMTYDNLNRQKLYKIYQPAGKEPFAEIEYIYYKNNPHPGKVIYRNLLDKKENIKTF